MHNELPPPENMVIVCDSLPSIEWAALAALPHQLGPEAAVFRVPVAESRPYASRLYPVLTAAERERASRYHQLTDHYRFLTARAALRVLLGAYTQRPPTSLRLEPGVNSKPVLRDAPGLHYNVSHSGNWILIAIATTEIGVDIERIDPHFPFRDIIDQSFSPSEKEFIARSPDSRELFYQLWTRKEALVKATAQGIDADFAQVPALAGRHQLPGPAGEWAVRSFDVAAGYAAVVTYPLAVAGLPVLYDAGAVLFSAL